MQHIVQGFFDGRWTLLQNSVFINIIKVFGKERKI